METNRLNYEKCDFSAIFGKRYFKRLFKFCSFIFQKCFSGSCLLYEAIIAGYLS